MTIAFFDSSALVKLLVDEPGSEVAEHLWNEADVVGASRLAHFPRHDEQRGSTTQPSARFGASGLPTGRQKGAPKVRRAAR